MRKLYNINVLSHFSNIYKNRYNSILKIEDIKYTHYLLPDWNFAYTMDYDNAISCRVVINDFEYILVPTTYDSYLYLLGSLNTNNINKYEIFNNNNIIKILMLSPSRENGPRQIILDNDINIEYFDYVSVDVSNNIFVDKLHEFAKKFDSDKIIYSKIVTCGKSQSDTYKLMLNLENQESEWLKMCSDFDFINNNELFKKIYDKTKIMTTVNNVEYILSKCYKDLDKSLKFPKVFEGDDFKILKDICYKRFYEYVKNGKADITEKSRLDYELSEIEKCKISGYFLIYHDVIKFCDDNDIYHGDRGSAASSYVNYILGITTFNPVKYNLMFDRFLSVNRIKPKVVNNKIYVEDIPDCDIDFQTSKRNLVIDFLTTKYKGVQIGNYQTLKIKNSILEVCRRLNISFKDSLEYSKSVQDENTEDVENLNIPDNIKQHCKNLFGVIKSIGTHASGVLITPEDPINTLPLYKMEDNKYNTLWVEGRGINRITAHGYIKLDILALKNLDILYSVCKRVKTEYTSIDYESINDKIINFYLENTDRLKYIFQLESQLAKFVFTNARPKNFEDIISLVSLIRPGILASNVDKKYYKSKNVERIKIHPKLESILGSTYGCILFQEQYMQILNKIGGFDMVEVNNIRKIISKSKETFEFRSKLLDEKYKNVFIENAIKELKEGFSSLDEARNYCENLWNEIVNLGQYCFNKAHATSYAITTAREMILKYKYYYIYMEEALNHDDSEIIDIMKTLITEFKKIHYFSLKDSPVDKFVINQINGEVYIPLKFVKYLTTKDILQLKNSDLVNAKSIQDVVDFFKKNKINKLKIKSLIFSGALDYVLEEPIFDNRNKIWKLLYEDENLDPQEEEVKLTGLKIKGNFYTKIKYLLTKENIDSVYLLSDFVKFNIKKSSVIAKIDKIYDNTDYYKIYITDDVVKIGCFMTKKFANNIPEDDAGIICDLARNGEKYYINNIKVLTP